ncbi:aldo/keto reductase [Bacillus sp. B15-48]|uniref:aldo/keto reductase n=1 Tax=Bacillus sp. B15-48 TaxID=1548601 RepID=UPI00193F06C9|nr:aldo/keto reductase [Bacillus sp. B15-48]MBM4763340.1 oxidoreductase [Bacillus sp. B15-48]
MQFTTLKKTDIRVTKIGVGTNKVGGHNIFPNLDETEGKEFLKAALDQGINFIDTADYYGLGRSEELIGEVLQEIDIKREDLVIATKGGMQWNEKGEITFNNRPEYLRSAFEASLRRLQTDYVDVYYLHMPDNITPFSESMGELLRLKEEGKIRAIAASNLNFAQIKEVNEIAGICSTQAVYNIFERGVEKDVLPYCVENDISFLPYYPLSSGLLGGNYKVTDTPPKHFKGKLEEFRTRVEQADRLKEFAESKGTTLPNLALAWLLAQDGVDVVIPGGRKPSHAIGTVQAADITLTPNELAEIDKLIKQEVKF